MEPTLSCSESARSSLRPSFHSEAKDTPEMMTNTDPGHVDVNAGERQGGSSGGSDRKGQKEESGWSGQFTGGKHEGEN